MPTYAETAEDLTQMAGRRALEDWERAALRHGAEAAAQMAKLGMPVTPPLPTDDLLRAADTGVVSPQPGTLVVDQQIEDWFTPHVLFLEQAERIAKIQEGAKAFAYVLRATLTPQAPEYADVMRKLREVMMLANAGIACGK